MRRVYYGLDEFVDVVSLTDEMKFVELMKLYKFCDTPEDLENVLIKEAKEAIRLMH